MALRTLLRAAAPAAAVALALASGLTAAQASSTPGWRITKLVESPAGYTFLQGVAASGKSDAWVVGTTVQTLVIDRWNGGRWKPLAVPAAFTLSGSGGVNDSVIGAASAGDMWTFPAVSNGTTNVNYALQRDGGTWKTFKLTGANVISGTAVFSLSDAWAFGFATGNAAASGYPRPYVARFNGHAWKRASMPGDALGVSPLSANDIWAYGPSVKSLGQSTPDVIAMHWNGKAWGTLAVPRYKLSGQRAYVQQLVALGPSDLWAYEDLPVNRGTGQPAGPGLVLAHWNGHRWSSVIKDTSDTGMGALVSDGHGGVWLQAVNVTSGADEFLHYSAGRLSRVAEPTRAGYDTSGGISGVALIPGTESLWAVGGATSNASGAEEGAILKYGR
jgi:hypothetical protein